MVLVSYSGREINAKLVYYGPGLSGKTTNLEYIYSSIPQGQRGKMVSMKTKTERTLFFDFLPVHLGELSGFKTRFLLYTVPGQVYYNATRKLVLKGVDAVVFVADSKRGKMDENVESLENLKENLKDLGLSLDKLPWVIQYNKRDLADVYAVEELEAVLNPGRAPAYQGVASAGTGVVETFKGISRLLLRKLAKDVGVPVVGSTVDAGESPASVSMPTAGSAAAAAQAVSDDPAWASPAPSKVRTPPIGDVPIAVVAPASPWSADRAADAVARTPETVPRGEAEMPVPELDHVATVTNTGWQLPPVAEPVRIPPPSADSVEEWTARRDGDESADRHVSVGERLRRWLARAPEPEDASEDRMVQGLAPTHARPPLSPPVAPPAPPPQPAQLLQPPAALPSAPPLQPSVPLPSGPAPQPASSSPPAPEPFQPLAEMVIMDRSPARTDEATEWNARTKPPAEPEWGLRDTHDRVLDLTPPSSGAATGRASVPGAPLEEAVPTQEVLASAATPPPAVAEPYAASGPTTTPPPAVAESWVASGPIQAPSTASVAPDTVRESESVLRPMPEIEQPGLGAPRAQTPERGTPPAGRRRRPREIVVPLELGPEDLADGVVLKVIVRKQEVVDDLEDGEDRYAA